MKPSVVFIYYIVFSYIRLPPTIMLLYGERLLNETRAESLGLGTYRSILLYSIDAIASW